MADFVELANSYYRLLRWIENAEVEKKAPAFRALERVKRFLSESNVEIVDLTELPFSEGWAVKVLKIDDGVPENELVFTRMIKPIIQINGDLAQEGEVYVGKLASAPKCESVQRTEPEAPVITEESPVVADESEAEPCNVITVWFSKMLDMTRSVLQSRRNWIAYIGGVAALIMVILLVCTWSEHAALKSELEALEQRVETLTIACQTNQFAEGAFVTYELHYGGERIVVTQPVEEFVVSSIDINGTQMSITTSPNSATTEGE